MAKAQPHGIEVPSGTPPEMAQQLEKIQQVFEDIYRQLPEGEEETEFSAGSLAGRGSASSGALQEITLGDGLEMDGRVLNVSSSLISDAATYYAPLTDGDEVETELIFADGQCIMVEVIE